MPLNRAAFIESSSDLIFYLLLGKNLTSLFKRKWRFENLCPRHFHRPLTKNCNNCYIKGHKREYFRGKIFLKNCTENNNWHG